MALAVAATDDRHVDGVSERPVQRAGELRRVGEDRHVRETLGVERLANAGDLPVHHPARSDDGGAGRGLGDSDLGVDLQGGVVVDAATSIEHSAVAVVGVLVDAQVSDQHDLVADVVAQVGEGQLGDAVGVVGAAPGRRPCGPARRTARCP